LRSVCVSRARNTRWCLSIPHAAADRTCVFVGPVAIEPGIETVAAKDMLALAVAGDAHGLVRLFVILSKTYAA
jgi:hypothetical protein